MKRRFNKCLCESLSQQKERAREGEKKTVNKLWVYCFNEWNYNILKEQKLFKHQEFS